MKKFLAALLLCAVSGMALNEMQRSLLNLAEKQQKTILPNYTNGVAAQPNSFAHYLLAYNAAFDRDMQRLQAYYKRLNRSPMGATVLNGTGWPLDRDRMANLLGFDEIAYNTYDAGQVFPQEAPVEMGAVASSIAIHMGSFIEEIMQQYARAHNMPPSEFTYADACTIYQRLAQEDAALPQKLPLTEAEFRACLDPVAIVNNRAVKGGPQPAELKIMLAQADKDLAQNINWQKQAAAKVANAENRLNNEFAVLLR